MKIESLNSDYSYGANFFFFLIGWRKQQQKPWYLDENKFGSFGNHFLSSNVLGVGDRGVGDGATTSLNIK